ncbi:MAG TPA: hypothetical protein VFJ58_28070 [Armatimonadota bacterium]|nr:hypothetical protein [Armatimonadota bacterium]
MAITLPPELERAIEEQARLQGTTPELLAIDSLRKQFLTTSASPPAEGTLLDFLGEFIGCIHSSEYVSGGAQMSVVTGRKFASGMVKKRRMGRL